MPRPPRPWFRFYSETLENEKAFKLGREHPEMYVDWTLILCLANLETPRGWVPSTAKVAFALRRSEAQVQATLTTLRQLRFLDRHGSRLVVHGWEEWQRRSDARDSEGRSESDEQRKQTGGKWENPSPKKKGNAAVAPPLRRRTAATDVDVDVDEEEDVDVDEEEDGEIAHARDPSDRPNIFKFYEQAIGPSFSTFEQQRMVAMEEEFDADCIEHSFREAAELGKRSLRYVDAICKRHKQEGCYAGKPGATGAGAHNRVNSDQARGLTSAEQAVTERLGIGKPRELVVD